VREANSGIGRRFVEFVGGESVDRLIVVSPYWDERLDALNTLTQSLAPATTSVLLDLEQHEFPVDAPLPAAIELRDISTWRKGRFTHAKILIASTSTHDHVLVGSANCTTAALGRNDFGGTNAEACIYRMLPRDRAIEVLELGPWVEGEPLDLEDIEPREASRPIPLRDITSRRPGSFELEEDILTWSPPEGLVGSGSIHLLDASASEIDVVPFDDPSEAGPRRVFHVPTKKPEQISFAVVAQDDFVSNTAHVTHRALLRRRRREVASGSIAKAIAAFDASADFDLWMHQAFDELARADLAERPYSPIVAAKPRTLGNMKEDEAPRHLTYHEFMETRSPDTRDSAQRDSTLTGTHSDSIRSFLNMLAGHSTTAADPDVDPNGDESMPLGDEDDGQEPNAQPSHVESGGVVTPAVERTTNERPVDGKLYETMVCTYVSNLSAGNGALGPSDVLRLRFWLMMLLHKARHSALPKGLKADTNEQGWPRLAFRVITAFFCGKRPPVTRLMIAREYTEMPVDFLESWVTVLWTLDAIDKLLAVSTQDGQFLGFLRRVRADVVRILGLTPIELGSATVVELKAALDRTVGARLGLVEQAAT
jgi:hypothetical protein